MRALAITTEGARFQLNGDMSAADQFRRDAAVLMDQMTSEELGQFQILLKQVMVGIQDGAASDKVLLASEVLDSEALPN